MRYAGDYNADEIIILGTSGKKSRNLDISDLVIELNVYESIYKQSLTGSIVVLDSIDLMQEIPLTGNERISFRMQSARGTIDASADTGHPMYIYKMTDKQRVGEGIDRYTLHFCSREMLRSIRTRVSHADEGPIDEIVSRIFTDKQGLDSRKRLHFEPTRNSDKYTFPNLRPLDAIAMLSNKALSEHGKSAGYYFYETTQGYYFRSYENMVGIHSRMARPAAEKYDHKVRNSTVGNRSNGEGGPRDGGNPGGNPNAKNIFDDFRSVDSYSFINTYDSAAHQATGTYASHMIMHDFYTKTYQEVDFNYHDNYNEELHTDSFRQNKPYNERFPISTAPIDYDQLSVSDYPKSRISLLPTSRFLHNEDTGIFGVQPQSEGLLEAKRVSQQNSIANGIKLEMIVPGQCQLVAGDVIDFDLRTLSKQKLLPGSDTKDVNHAGRYLITTLRHTFKPVIRQYQCHMKCVKDSLFNELPNDDDVSFPPEKSFHRSSSGSSNTKAELIDLSSSDDQDNRESYRGRY